MSGSIITQSSASSQSLSTPQSSSAVATSTPETTFTPSTSPTSSLPPTPTPTTSPTSFITTSSSSTSAATTPTTSPATTQGTSTTSSTSTVENQSSTSPIQQTTPSVTPTTSNTPAASPQPSPQTHQLQEEADSSTSSTSARVLAPTSALNEPGSASSYTQSNTQALPSIATTLTVNGHIPVLTQAPDSTSPLSETDVPPNGSDSLNSPAGATSTSRRTVAIVSAVMGTLGLIALVAIGFLLYRQRQRKRRIQLRNNNDRPISVESWVQFSSRPGSVVGGGSEESAVWHQYGDMNGKGDAMHVPYGASNMLQASQTAVSLLPNVSTISLDLSFSPPPQSSSGGQFSLADLAKNDKGPLSAESLFSASRLLSPPATAPAQGMVTTPNSAVDSVYLSPTPASPSSAYLVRSPSISGPEIQIQSPSSQGSSYRPNQLSPSSADTLEVPDSGLNMFRGSIQSTITQGSRLSAASAYSVPSPVYPDYNAPPLPPLPSAYSTSSNFPSSAVPTPIKSTISEKPGPRLLTAEPVTSPHRESIAASPGDNIDMFLDLGRPTRELLRTVGLDESVQKSPKNPFRDSNMSYSLSTGRTPGPEYTAFEWTVR
ncbi:hypothetical protein BXZ70DRAFT_1006943 [Cristinia sonorae]|uniref:Uncharacterized protein n=1 Tax=Cristinia sonorae TaxID=1940300 RepID=A0A8K0XQT3_9AGAR|nr:hypothetical protein BXZ70DRAFT_1006943 [Cristinia sonorae]